MIPHCLSMVLPALVAIVSVYSLAQQADAQPLFVDDFESGLDHWEVSNLDAITIIDSSHADHGRVLKMSPADARLHALIRGSDSWNGYRIEGDVLFPTDEDNYLGLIYHFQEQQGRVDLGSLYIKGNGSYIRVNPRRDWNPARCLYEEYTTKLTGDDAIRIGRWQRFAAEVIGHRCHFYVGNLTTPKVTFDLYENDSGKVGFKPRVVGGPVWIDDVRASAIDQMSYDGPPQPPGISHDPDRLITEWSVLGPLTRTYAEVESAATPGAGSVVDNGITQQWRKFPTDARGAVVTGKVTDFLGSKTVAYFATVIEVNENEDVELEFSSIDDLTIWVNGVLQGYEYGDYFAWHDFGANEEHPPTGGSDALSPGLNHVLVRVRGGRYAKGGFFARVVRTARGER